MRQRDRRSFDLPGEVGDLLTRGAIGAGHQKRGEAGDGAERPAQIMREDGEHPGFLLIRLGERYGEMPLRGQRAAHPDRRGEGQRSEDEEQRGRDDQFAAPRPCDDVMRGFHNDDQIGPVDRLHRHEAVAGEAVGRPPRHIGPDAGAVGGRAFRIRIGRRDDAAGLGEDVGGLRRFDQRAQPLDDRAVAHRRADDADESAVRRP